MLRRAPTSRRALGPPVTADRHPRGHTSQTYKDVMAFAMQGGAMRRAASSSDYMSITLEGDEEVAADDADDPQAPWHKRVRLWAKRTWRRCSCCTEGETDPDEYENLQPRCLSQDQEEEDWLPGYQRSLVRGDSLGSIPPPLSHRMQRRSQTISVELLRRKDKQPAYLAWASVVMYLGTGLWYFMALKRDSLRDALFMTLNSLSAVSWGNFDPSTPFQRALTVVFLFAGVGFVGSIIGILASRGLDFQDTVKSDWLKAQQEQEGIGGAATTTTTRHVTLLEAQMRSARQRLSSNVLRILLAMAMGTLILAPLEGWTLAYSIYFSAQMLMGAGWVDVMPVTTAGSWFTLLYSVMGSLLIYHALGDLASIPLAIRQTRYEVEVLSQWGDALTEDKLRSLARRADEIGNPRPQPPPILEVAGQEEEEEEIGGESKQGGVSTASSSCSSGGGGVVEGGAMGEASSGGGSAPGKVQRKGSGLQVTRDEFVISNLMLLGKIDLADVRESQKVFDTLDKDRTGILDEADIVRHVDKRGFHTYRRISGARTTAAAATAGGGSSGSPGLTVGTRTPVT